MSKEKCLQYYVQNYFQSYLKEQKGVSQNTILSYRDTMKMFFKFISKRKQRKISKITLQDMEIDNVLEYLNSIERERSNSIVTRNLRLASLKTFFNYLSIEDPEHINQYHKILLMPLKRAPKKHIEHLNINEVKSILSSIGRRSDLDKRDLVLLTLLYNTGMRVQEVCDLKVASFCFSSPATVKIVGKGNKTRIVPLWPETVSLVSNLIDAKCLDHDENIFKNNRGENLSRFGVNYIIKKRSAIASKKCSTLRDKTIGPHTYRHTLALHLLQAGVDITIIKSWLGHVSINTTHGYIEIDLEMKRKALAMSNSVLSKLKLNKIIKDNNNVINWLESL